MLAGECWVLQFCTVVGVLFVGKWTLSFLCGLWKCLHVVISSYLWKKNLVAEYGGKWAVVTGSTDGIGKEYARQLAQQGMNVILISRSPDKLKNVEQEIKQEFGVDTHTITADFSHGHQIYNGIAKGLKGKDIGILVNNVGFYGPKPRKFNEITEDEIWRYVNVNVASVLAMTKLVLPQMLARRQGAIINMSSFTATIPVPYSAAYSATKALVTYFSEALEYEYRDSGITMQCLRPGIVVTNMTSFSKYAQKPGFTQPSTARFVSSAFSSLGHSTVTAGTWDHELMTFIVMCLGKRLSMFFFDKYTKLLLGEEGKDSTKTH